MTSVGPPAANGTIIVIGLLGKAWAKALATPSARPVPIIRIRRVKDIFFSLLLIERS